MHRLLCNSRETWDTYSSFGLFFLGCLLKKMKHVVEKESEKTYGGSGNLLSGRSRLLSSGSLGSRGRLGGGGLNNLDFLGGGSNGGLGS